MNKPFHYLTPFSYSKLRTLIVIVGATAIAVLDVCIRKRIGGLIDLLGDGRIAEFAFFTFGLMVLLYILISFLLPYVKTRLADHVQEIMYRRLYDKALTASQVFLDKIDAGKVSTYFTSDIAGIIRYVNRMTTIAIPDAFTFLISSAALMTINPWIGIAAVVSSVIPVVTVYLLSRFLVSGNMKYQQVLQQINGHITKYFFNLEFIKACQMEEALETENARLLNQLLKNRKHVARNEAFLSFPMMLTSFVTILIVAVLGGYLVSSGEILMGELFTAITLVDYIVNPVMRFENTIRQIRKAEANIVRINQYIELPDTIDGSCILFDSAEECSLEIRDLEFGYSGEKKVFNGLDFSWVQGKLNVLVGENGTGKSTLLKILAGIYEPQKGIISVRLKNLNKCEKLSLQNIMTVDPQKTVLFADTISNNLALGRDIPKKRIRDICRAVGIDDEIMAMPDEYDTKLGINGSPLSGGQKRRLCVARTLLRDAAIYIFDEPTAGIDPGNLDRMIEVLRLLAKEKLVLVITHEQSLIAAADTITQLEVCS